MGKVDRQQFIRHLVSSKSIISQDELKEHLIAAGYNVAQATLSRDIKEMSISKNASGYHLPEAPREQIDIPTEITETVPKGSVKSLEYGLGVAVMRTAPGHASMVAAVIDEAQLSPIIGTIAGDDTVLLILRPIYSNDFTTMELSALISDLKVVD